MSTNYSRHFTQNDTMLELIGEDFNILPILSRFSLPLGFGSNTIGEVCESAHIDVDIFLLIVNFMLSGHIDPELLASTDVGPLVDFLHNSHDYFLLYKFPHIRANLVNALDSDHSDINPAIMQFFDEYVEQVRLHFRYEESTVFPYIRRLAEGSLSGDYNIGIFCKNHEEISDSLTELKNIILRYYTTSMPNRMYDALVDIFNVEEDMDTHTDIENHILIPMVAHIEHQLKKKKE